MDGKTVARRSTRTYTEDGGPNTTEGIMGNLILHKQPSNNVESREKCIDGQRPGRSRSSSASTSRAAAVKMDLGTRSDVLEKEFASVDGSTPAEESNLGRDQKIPGCPVNFGTIFPGVYRSGYPQADDYGFLGTLGLRTILTLVEKDAPEGYAKFMQDNGIKHIVINMEGTKKVSIPPAVMASIMKVVMDRRNYPILIHCNHGKHRTGCVAAVFRKIMGGTLETTIQEYKRFADPKARDVDVEYITDFEVESLSDLVVNLRRHNNAPWGLPASSQTPTRMAKMGRFLVFTGVALCIWTLTLTCWQD